MLTGFPLTIGMAEVGGGPLCNGEHKLNEMFIMKYSGLFFIQRLNSLTEYPCEL